MLRLSLEEMRRSTVPPRFEAWDSWIYARHFHLILFSPPGPGQSCCILTMRKYTRTVYDISKEIYERFPGGRLNPPATSA